MKISEIEKPFTAYLIMPFKKRDFGGVMNQNYLYDEISQIRHDVLLKTGILLHPQINIVADDNFMNEKFHHFTCTFHSLNVYQNDLPTLKNTIVLFVEKLLTALKDNVAIIVFADETLLVEPDLNTMSVENQKFQYFFNMWDKLYEETIFFKPETSIIEKGAPFFWIVDDVKKELIALNEILRGIINGLNDKITREIKYSQIYFWIKCVWAYELDEKKLSLLTDSEKDFLASYVARMIIGELKVENDENNDNQDH